MRIDSVFFPSRHRRMRRPKRRDKSIQVKRARDSALNLNWWEHNATGGMLRWKFTRIQVKSHSIGSFWTNATVDEDSFQFFFQSWTAQLFHSFERKQWKEWNYLNEAVKGENWNKVSTLITCCYLVNESVNWANFWIENEEPLRVVGCDSFWEQRTVTAPQSNGMSRLLFSWPKWTNYSNHSLDFYFIYRRIAQFLLINFEADAICIGNEWKMSVKLGAGGSPGRQVDRFLSEIERKCETKENWSLVSSCFIFSGQKIDATSEASAHRSVRSSSIDLRPPPRVTIAVPSIHQKLDRFACSTKKKCNLISTNDLCFHFVIF